MNRGDKLAEYRTELGLAQNFSAIQFRIPALWLHTVGELKAMADDMRDPAYQQRIQSVIDETAAKEKPLWERLVDELDENTAKQKGRKTYS